MVRIVSLLSYFFQKICRKIPPGFNACWLINCLILLNARVLFRATRLRHPRCNWKEIARACWDIDSHFSSGMERDCLIAAAIISEPQSSTRTPPPCAISSGAAPALVAITGSGKPLLPGVVVSQILQIYSQKSRSRMSCRYPVFFLVQAGNKIQYLRAEAARHTADLIQRIGFLDQECFL